MPRNYACFLTWFIMEDFRPKRLSGKRKRLLLLPSSDSDLTNFSLSPFSFSCSFCRHFFLRLRRSLALLELSFDISEELHDRRPPPSSSTASSDTVPAEVAMAAACREGDTWSQDERQSVTQESFGATSCRWLTWASSCCFFSCSSMALNSSSFC